MGAILAALVAGLTITLIHFGLRHAAQKRKQLADAWTNSCRDLGLSFAKGPHSDRPIHKEHYRPEMYGQYQGTDVYVGCRTYTTGSGSNTQTHYRTYVDIVFPVPLKRGLSITPAAVFFQAIFGQNDVQLGITDFDKHFKVLGHEPDQIRWLLVGLEQALVKLVAHDSLFMPELDDYRLRLEARGNDFPSETLRWAIDTAVKLYAPLARNIDEAPLTGAELAFAPVAKRLAARLGVPQREKGMWVGGEFDAFHAWCEVKLGDHHWETAIFLSFRPPLTVQLDLAREGTWLKVKRFFGAQDIVVGDSAFDDHFVIKGTDERRVREILTADATEALLALDRLATLHVCDRWVAVELDHIATDPDVVEELLERLLAAATAMTEFRTPKPSGPYR